MTDRRTLIDPQAGVDERHLLSRSLCQKALTSSLARHCNATSQCLPGETRQQFNSSADEDGATTTLLAYVSINLSRTALSIEGADTWVVLGSLLKLSQVNNIERLMQWSIYDDVTLITPTGAVLTGALKPDQVLNEGVNFNRDGLVFKLTSPGESHWTAIYVISVQSFLDYALWPLLCLVALVVAMLGCVVPSIAGTRPESFYPPKARTPASPKAKRSAAQ